MTLIGFLHYRLDPRKITKTYAFAAVAKAEGLDFFYFTPGKIDFEKKVIFGKVVQNGEWVEKVFPFPDVVYNAGTSSSKKSQEKITKLQRVIPFTSHSVGSKNKIYNQLRKSQKFAKYLIPSKTVVGKNSIYSYLEKHKKIILKPNSGRQGDGIYYVEKVNKNYLIIEKSVRRKLNSIEFDHFLKSIVSDRYIVQKYVSCKTKNDSSFDFRIHIQKNGQAKWVVTDIYGRISPPGSIICNISNGGSTIQLKPLLTQEFPGNYEALTSKLNALGLDIGIHMDKKYGKSFDELGIDIGIDKNKNIWLYEVNWRPGVPPSFYLELDVVKNTLHYAVYLARNK